MMSYFFVNCMMTISAVSFLAHVNNKPIDDDKPLDSWIKTCLVEDVDYIGSAYSEAQKFIKQQLGQ